MVSIPNRRALIPTHTNTNLQTFLRYLLGIEPAEGWLKCCWVARSAFLSSKRDRITHCAAKSRNLLRTGKRIVRASRSTA